ncbi:hypothetical protein B0919_17150 [Hymenobacter sp. CRA2]|nr:hypothetical protein B0919_17150 [Hymenobacter sp. CRA2]
MLIGRPRFVAPHLPLRKGEGEPDDVVEMLGYAFLRFDFADARWSMTAFLPFQAAFRNGS